MNNTIEALQALYVALGGESADVADITTIPEMIAAITAISGGGSGKSGGGDTFSVTITQASDYSYSSDKTYEEIISASQNGQIVTGKIVSYDGYTFPLTLTGMTGENCSLGRLSYSPALGQQAASLYDAEFVIAQNGTVTNNSVKVK